MLIMGFCYSVSAGLCNLQSINLSFTLVTDISMKKISMLNSLKAVNLDNRQITDVGLAALTSMYHTGIVSSWFLFYSIYLWYTTISKLIVRVKVYHILSFVLHVLIIYQILWNLGVCSLLGSNLDHWLLPQLWLVIGHLFGCKLGALSCYKPTFQTFSTTSY